MSSGHMMQQKVLVVPPPGAACVLPHVCKGCVSNQEAGPDGQAAGVGRQAGVESS